MNLAEMDPYAHGYNPYAVDARGGLGAPSAAPLSPYGPLGNSGRPPLGAAPPDVGIETSVRRRDGAPSGPTTPAYNACVDDLIAGGVAPFRGGAASDPNLGVPFGASPAAFAISTPIAARPPELARAPPPQDPPPPPVAPTPAPPPTASRAALLDRVDLRSFGMGVLVALLALYVFRSSYAPVRRPGPARP